MYLLHTYTKYLYVILLKHVIGDNMENKKAFYCPRCSGVLFIMYDVSTWSRRIYYKEIMQCLMCGRHYKKSNLYRKYILKKEDKN